MTTPSSFPVLRPEFARLVAAVVTRMLAQTGLPPASEDELARLASLLEQIGVEEGWARRRAAAGGELPEALVRSWVDRVVALFPARETAVAPLAKQLLKGCFQAEPSSCRLSYRQQDASGRCRRQELDYARSRLSGTHCIDCPYWRQERADHAAWLAGEWHAMPASLAAGLPIFLPEDFRALRNGALPVT